MHLARTGTEVVALALEVDEMEVDEPDADVSGAAVPGPRMVDLAGISGRDARWRGGTATRGQVAAMI